MKKLFYLLLLLPMAMITSCSKDEIAPFDMTLSLAGVTQVDGTFYAVAGDNITIDGLTVQDTGGKKTALSNVMFFIGGAPIFPNPWNALDPWTFSTENLEPGTYNFGISGNLLQVDASIQSFAANYKLIIVGSQDDLPEGAPEIGTYSSTISFTN